MTAPRWRGIAAVSALALLAAVLVGGIAKSPTLAAVAALGLAGLGVAAYRHGRTDDPTSD